MDYVRALVGEHSWVIYSILGLILIYFICAGWLRYINNKPDVLYSFEFELSPEETPKALIVHLHEAHGIPANQAVLQRISSYGIKRRSMKYQAKVLRIKNSTTFKGRWKGFMNATPLEYLKATDVLLDMDQKQIGEMLVHNSVTLGGGISNNPRNIGYVLCASYNGIKSMSFMEVPRDPLKIIVVKVV
jgi:hypothetical protein